MSVSKRIGNAVTRNAVRRRLKEIFRSVSADVLGQRDIVISARPAAAEATFGELESEFLRALERLDNSGCSRRPE